MRYQDYIKLQLKVNKYINSLMISMLYIWVKNKGKLHSNLSTVQAVQMIKKMGKRKIYGLSIMSVSM